MAQPGTPLLLDLQGLPTDDAEELEQLTGLLREELLQLDLAAVERAPKAAPSGARAGESAAAGVLAVALLGGSGVLPMVVEAVRAWLARAGGRSLKIAAGDDVLEVSGISSEQQERLIEAWLERQQRTAGAPGAASGP